jgi:hypothetical protein
MIRYPSSYDELTVESGTAYSDIDGSGDRVYSFIGAATIKWES